MWFYVTSVNHFYYFQLKDYVKPQPISSCLATLEKFMLSSHPVCASAIVSVKIKDGSSKSATAAETVADILGIKDIGEYCIENIYSVFITKKKWNFRNKRTFGLRIITELVWSILEDDYLTHTTSKNISKYLIANLVKV